MSLEPDNPLGGALLGGVLGGLIAVTGYLILLPQTDSVVLFVLLRALVGAIAGAIVGPLFAKIKLSQR